MKSTVRKPSEVSRKWYEINARDFTLGRLSTLAARYLAGKQHIDFTPHVDMGDFVVVLNAPHIRLTGRKLDQKKYHRFSGYPGGITTTNMKDMLLEHPDQVIREAIRRMLPKNKLARLQLRRLHIILGEAHNFKIDQKLK